MTGPHEPVVRKSRSTAARTWVKRHVPQAVKSALAPYIPTLHQALLNDPARTGAYKTTWIDPAYRSFHQQAQARQQQENGRPFPAETLIDEVRATLRTLKPQSVLHVGCESGQLTSALAAEFSIEGCDPSPEALRQCPEGLRVFEYDIAVEPNQFIRDHVHGWDVLLVCGMLGAWVNSPLRATYALNGLLMLAARRIVIWDWPEVCTYYQQLSDSAALEFHPYIPPVAVTHTAESEAAAHGN